MIVLLVIIIIIIIVIIKIIIIIIVIMIWIPTAITVNHCDLDHCPKLDEGGKEGKGGTIDNGDRKQILLRQVVRYTCPLAHGHTCASYRTRDIFYFLERCTSKA